MGRGFYRSTQQWSAVYEAKRWWPIISELRPFGMNGTLLNFSLRDTTMIRPVYTSFFIPPSAASRLVSSFSSSPP